MGNSVFVRMSRVERLKLRLVVPFKTFRHSVEFNKGGVTYQFENILIGIHWIIHSNLVQKLDKFNEKKLVCLTFQL